MKQMTATAPVPTGHRKGSAVTGRAPADLSIGPRTDGGSTRLAPVRFVAGALRFNFSNYPAGIFGRREICDHKRRRNENRKEYRRISKIQCKPPGLKIVWGPVDL